MPKKKTLIELPTRVPLDQLIDDINRDLGGFGLVQKASESYAPYKIRRPTGITSVDAGIGGGFAAGSLNQLFGPPGTCKNFLADQVVRQVQKNYGEDACVFWASFGYTYDKSFGKLNGVSVAFSEQEIQDFKDDLAERGGVLDKLVEKKYRTQVGNFHIVHLGGSDASIEKPAEAVLNTVVKLLRTGRFQVGFIDELNLAETRFSAEKRLGEDPKQADQAGLLTRFLKKFTSSLNAGCEDGANKTTLVTILEARAKIGGFSRNPNATTQGGGYALKHMKAADITLKKGDRLMVKTRQIGNVIKWRVDKGKLGIHEGAEGEFPYYFGVGVDLEEDLVKYARSIEALDTKGSWNWFNGERIANGVTDTAAIFKENRDLYEAVRKAVLDKSGASLKVK